MPSPGDRMPPELDATADALSVAWNVLVRGEPAVVDAVSPFAPTLRRLHAADDAPALSPERQARIWSDVLASQRVAPSLVVLGPIPPASLNGHAPAPAAVAPQAARQRWPMTFLASAAALALMLVSVLLTLGLSQPNGWLRPAQPPAVLADDIVFRQRLDALPPDLTRVTVNHATLPPGALWEQGTRTTSGVGPMLYRVETGAVETQAYGAFQVTRRGATTATGIPAGTTVDLAPGDVAFLPAGVASQWRNRGNAPATLLDAGLTNADAAGSAGQSFQVASIAGSPSSWPAAPADLTLRRVTLAPGAALSGAAPGDLQFVGVDAGVLEIGLARPGVANAIVDTRQVAAGHWADLAAGDLVAARLRNPGDKPLTLLLLTVAPAATPPLVQTEPLLAGRFDAVDPDASWIGVERYTAPPGAAWSQGATQANGVGPMLYRIEQGAVTVRNDGAISVTRAGAPQPASIAPGATTTLASGDVAFMPSGVVTRWRNDGTEPAVILDGGITSVGVADTSMFQPYTMPINDWGVQPPKAPVDFAVQRVTIAPGGVSRSGPAAGVKLLAVESGAADIIWAQPIAAALQAPRPAASTAQTPAPTQLGAGHWLDIQQSGQYASELRNAGSKPLVVLLLTAATANGAQPPPQTATP